MIKSLFNLCIRRRSREGRRGQAMVEFSLVVPVLFFALFGVFEAALMTYSVGSARYAAADAGKFVSERGNLTNSCPNTPGCMKVYNSAGKACDADCTAIGAVNLGPLGTTSIATVDEMDVQKLMVACDGTVSVDNGSGGCVGPSANGCPCLNRYTTPAGGSPVASVAAAGNNYSPTTRGVTLGKADLVAVTIKFHYVWKTGFFASITPPILSATYRVLLEPQKF